MEVGSFIDLVRQRTDALDIAQLKASGLLPLHNLHYRALYYPPSKFYTITSPANSEEEIFKGLVYRGNPPLVVYIHIPFCPQKCMFCYFLTYVDSSERQIDQYLDYLEKEFALWQARLETKISPHALFIGGGSPTFLSCRQLERLLTIANNGLNFFACKEFTVEAEPGTLAGIEGSRKLDILKNHGVNRICLGVQSFNDEILRAMGRHHTVSHSKDAIQQIKNKKFQSICIDLLYGFPGITLEMWIQDLLEAHTLDVDGYELYRLRIVPHGYGKAQIRQYYENNKHLFPDLNMTCFQKMSAKVIASHHGFQEYYRMFFSRNQQYNPIYQLGRTQNLYDTIGLGISASSVLQGRYMENTSQSLEHYYSFIEKGRLALDRGRIRTSDDNQRRAFVLPLKHCGINKTQYQKNTGLSIQELFGARIEKLKKYGLIEDKDGAIVLTEKGSIFADEVVTQFYAPEYLPFPKSDYPAGELSPYND
ncbi:MAG: coproporphyrinogen-III oxidase family protein [Candidatus Omnitrophota bacterium]|nr:coproporphyrinogen III oxidase family protein [Candidatus Omnitrophota bacterium]